MKNVFILGGTTFDHVAYFDQLPQPEPRTFHQVLFREGTGSTGSGKAFNLNALGVPLCFYSVLGNDSWGEHIIGDLYRAGIDFFYDHDPAGTERHINLLDAEGRRISLFITQSGEQTVKQFDEIQSRINKADVLVLNIIAYCKSLAPLVQASGKPVWTDLHDYTLNNPYHEPFIEAAEFIQLSSDNLPEYREAMQQFHERGKSLVVCTHGAAGVDALDANGTWYHLDAPPVSKLVDANGAGDAFFSGYLFGWMQGESIPDCLKLGTAAARLCLGSEKLYHPNLSSDELRRQVRSLWVE